jgi:5-oxoprolinase (ATP-hydrolysing) subunit C
MSLDDGRVAGLVTVQDLGRPGHMHEALPAGGAIVRELLVAANRTARNRDDVAAIEVFGQLVVRAESDVLVATDRSGLVVLRAGDELVVDSAPHRVGYLALRGGVDAPVVLGGRGAHLSAGLGALLRTGDRIAPGDAPDVDLPVVPFQPFVAGDPIRVVVGPDAEAFDAGALDALTSAPYRILPASDRVGTRLDGPALPRRGGYPEASRPMVIGAIEVPRDGAPIVLGPEHPTTGGYPIVAVIAFADLGRFFAIRLGGSVGFITAVAAS